MDILAFFLTVFAGTVNFFGMDDIVRTSLREAKARGEKAYGQFRVWLAAKIAGPMAWFMWICAAGMLSILGLTSHIHFKVWGLAFGDGQYPLVFFTTLISVGAISLWAAYQRKVGKRFLLDAQGNPQVVPVFAPLPEGHHGPLQMTGQGPARNPEFRPRKVSFFVSGFLLTLGITAESITLSLHALAIGSRGLWLISMLTRYLSIAVIATVLSVLAWIVLRGGGFLEKVLQVASETIAPLLPGVTFKNVKEKLFPKDLNLLDEEKNARRIAAVAMGIFILSSPFDLMVLVYPRNGTALFVGIPYAATLIGGMAAFSRPKLRDRLSAASDHFYWMIFKWPTIILVVSSAISLFVANTELGKGLWNRSEQGYDKVTEFVKREGSSEPKLLIAKPAIVPSPVQVKVTPPSPATVTPKTPAPPKAAGKPPVQTRHVSDNEVDARLDELMARRGLRVPGR